MQIAILGAGVEGLSLATYLLKIGQKNITLCDEKMTEVPLGYKWAQGKFGGDAFKNLNDFDVVFRSPGVAYTRTELKGLAGKLTSLTRYFFDKCPCPIIGVTGTKGKGTTSSLLVEMIKNWFKEENKGRRVFLGGNIGVPPTDFLSEVKKDDLVVLELSSFQLQDLTVSPHVAVVLGITDDHQDQHGGLQEYYDAKKNIVAHQKSGDIAIIDAENEISKGFAKATKAKVQFVKTGDEKVSSTLLRGVHNLKNIAMAAAAARTVGASETAISDAITSWPGLPHRLQFVCEKNGTQFFNDSASTNPSTTIAALKSFSEPVTLILGGSDKNLDFTPLAQAINEQSNVMRIILMGQTSKKIEKAIDEECTSRKSPLEVILAGSFMEAFMVAKLAAQKGEIVLLSPACASFGLFKNYIERGELFSAFMKE